MKFCVMMTAQRNTIVGNQGESWEEHDGQDVVSLQRIVASAASAGAISCDHGFRPALALFSVPERLFGASVDVVGVAGAGVQRCDVFGLSSSSLACLRAIRAVTTPVFTRLANSATHLARELFGPWVGQRPVDGVQDTFVLANGPDVPVEVLAGLEVGTEGAVGLRHHFRVRPVARPAAELALRGVSAAPNAVLSDHKRTLPEIGSLAP